MNEGNGRPMTKLEELAYKYSTDKFQHGYLPFYEKHLPKEPKRILEIGVKDGASIRMWLDHFPEATVYGLDLFAENDISAVYDKVVNYDTKLMERCHFIKGNQVDWQVLELLRKKDFDVIIDDGSHNSRDQMMTFFGLFNGKHYFIEDLHCCLDDFYSQGLPFDFKANILFSAIAGANMYYPNGPKINYGVDDKIVCIKSFDHAG